MPRNKPMEPTRLTELAALRVDVWWRAAHRQRWADEAKSVNERQGVRRMSANSVIDPELGGLQWNEELEFWEGSIRLSSSDAFELTVFARADLVTDRTITADARRAIAHIRTAEDACRSFACKELLAIHNAEWSKGSGIDASEFMRRLEPESVEVHESGYSEVHFRDGDLFWGHSVGVRIRPDGSFQEAVVEG